MSAIKVKDAEGNFIDIPTIQGEQGNVGPAGLGFPEGGTTGDIIVKNSNTDYDTMWKSLIDLVYPIGSLYFTTSTINPSTLFGGTWEQIKDKFILSAGDIYVNGATGGGSMHRHESPLTWGAPTDLSQAYVGTCNQFGSFNVKGQRGVYAAPVELRSEDTQSYAEALGYYTNYADSMPPYLAVNVWKRIS